MGTIFPATEETRTVTEPNGLRYIYAKSVIGAVSSVLQ